MCFTFPVEGSPQTIELLHGAEDWVNSLEVRHVIAEVLHWRAEEWAEPQRLHSEELKVVQALLNTCKTTTVGKTIMWIAYYNAEPLAQDGVNTQAWQDEYTKPNTIIFPCSCSFNLGVQV